MSEADMTVDDGGGRQRRLKVDYPSNSKGLKAVTAGDDEQPEKKVAAVVTGSVVRKKPGLAERLFGHDITEDGGSIAGFMAEEVLLPAARNMISETFGMIMDALREGMERKLFGEVRSRRNSGRPGYTSYGTKYVARTGPTSSGPPQTRRVQERHDFSEVILENRTDAEEVLDGLRELIERYDQASVSDFYELVGITPDFTDNKWGWTDLRDARVQIVRGGFILRLPRTQSLT